MITLDTSAVVELLTSSQSTIAQVLRVERGRRLIPAEILGEITYMTEVRLGRRYIRPFLDDLDGLTYTCDGGTSDRLPRICELHERYADLSLDFCDAAVVACAEAHGGRVLTLDRRDFDVIAREGRITVLP